MAVMMMIMGLRECGVMGYLKIYPHSPTFTLGSGGELKLDYPITPLPLLLYGFGDNLIPHVFP